MKGALVLAAALVAAALLRDPVSGEATDSPAGAGHAGSIKLLDRIEWKDSPALPRGAKVAVLEGDPTKAGYFNMRVKLPDGYRIPPHWHPCHERVTVLSGTFCLGPGETFDPAKAQALPPGTYWSMEPGMRHFAFAKGETVVQVTTVGPWGINYVNPSDDPRRKQ